MPEELKKMFAEMEGNVTNEMKAQIKEAFATSEKSLEEMKSEVERIKGLNAVKNMDTSVKSALGNLVKNIGGVDLGEKAVTFDTLMKDFMAIDEVAGGSEVLAGEQIYNAILEVAQEYGTLFPFAGKINTKERVFTFIKGNNAPTATGGFYAEGTNIPLEKLNFSKVSVTVKNWFRIIAIAKSTLEDGRPEDIGLYIIRELGKSYATLLDNQVATKMASAITQKVTTDTADEDGITLKKVLQVKGLVKSPYRERGQFFISYTNYLVLKLKESATGGYVFDITTSAEKMFLDGSRLVISDQLSESLAVGEAFLYFGELEEAIVIIERTALTIEQGEIFIQDLKLYKAKARLETEGKIPQAMAKLEMGTL